MAYEIGVWIKPAMGPVRRFVKDRELAKGLVDWAVGSSKILDWGFFDPAEDQPAPSLEFSGKSHRRKQRVKASDL